MLSVTEFDVLADVLCDLAVAQLKLLFRCFFFPCRAPDGFEQFALLAEKSIINREITDKRL